MKTSTTIRCHGIAYRQGFIEVRHDIHRGWINIESWMVDPNVDVTELGPSGDALSDSMVVANTELELSVASAGDLVRLLQQAIRSIENDS